MCPRPSARPPANALPVLGLGLVLLLASPTPALAAMGATTGPGTIAVDANEFHLLFDESDGGDITDFYNLNEDNTAPFTDKSSQSSQSSRNGLFHIGGRVGSSQPGTAAHDGDGTSTLQLLEETAARVRIRNNLDLGNGLVVVRDFSIYPSGKLYIDIQVTASDTVWDFWDKMIANSSLYSSNFSSKTDRVAILSDNGPLSDLLDIWYDDYAVDGQNAWAAGSWLDEQNISGSGYRLSGFDSGGNDANVPAGTYSSQQLVEFLRTDVTTTGNEWQPYADDYRNPAFPVMTEGSVWLEDGDGYNEAEGVYSLTMPASQLLQFDMNGASYDRIRPSFKVRGFEGLDPSLVAISLNGTLLEEGTDYFAAVKPFAEAWYDDGTAQTAVADGGEVGVSTEFLADPANTFSLDGFAGGTTLYLGSDSPFNAVNLDLTAPGTGGGTAWEYWDGSSWVQLLVTDVDAGASDLTASGMFGFRDGDLPGWAPHLLASGTEGFDGERRLFWIRATPLGSYLTPPAIRQARTDILLLHFLVDLNDTDELDVLGPGACVPAELANLQLDRSAGNVVLSWDSSADPCHQSYGTFTNTTAVGPAWLGSWTPAADADGSATNETLTYVPGAADLEYFLVTDIGLDGSPGPVGHYGQ